jgi:CubicO group peptidase (beta-lactamase class C family)
MSEIGGTRPLPVPSKDLSFLVGAGSLWATAHDLFDVTCRVSEGGYGAADAGARAADGSIHWMGFGNGFSANVDYDPTTDVTIVITSNLLTGAAECDPSRCTTHPNGRAFDNTARPGAGICRALRR